MDIERWSDEQLKAVGWTDKEIAIARGVPLPPSAYAPTPPPTPSIEQKLFEKANEPWYVWLLGVPKPEPWQNNKYGFSYYLGFLIWIVGMLIFLTGGAAEIRAQMESVEDAYRYYCEGGAPTPNLRDWSEYYEYGQSCDDLGAEINSARWIVTGFIFGRWAGWLWFGTGFVLVIWGDKSSTDWEIYNHHHPGK